MDSKIRKVSDYLILDYFKKGFLKLHRIYGSRLKFKIIIEKPSEFQSP
jgi:hypothetical protein